METGFEGAYACLSRAIAPRSSSKIRRSPLIIHQGILSNLYPKAKSLALKSLMSTFSSSAKLIPFVPTSASSPS